MRLTPTIVLLSSLLYAGNALAVFDAQISVGKGNIDEESESDSEDDSAGSTVATETETANTDITIAAHITPVPLAPFAIGLFATSRNMKVTGGDTEDYDQLDYKGLLYGPEVMAWIPGMPVVTPYVRVGYVMGKYTVDMAMVQDTDYGEFDVEAKMVSKTTGPKYAVGFGVDVVPAVSFFAEYSVTDETTKLESVDGKINGEEFSLEDIEDEEGKLASKTVMIGLSAGL